MGCRTCSVSKSGTPRGCENKGHCSSGSCNKMNTFDWLTTLELNDPTGFPVVEVSFKKGNRKAFFLNSERTRASTGDMVIVEAANGYDIGRITLSGDLVRAQMRKKKVNEDRIIHNVIRIANERDLSKLAEARKKEKPAMIKARQLARMLDLDMKIGDVEYQGDLRKATFFYIADGRVDFRELVRVYAKEFRVKIEMRQIGSRQESGLIGGVGACGRELCCSTWLSDFSTVTTSAARYQNIAINQTKLSGQCGRLKCCLNYELDMYMEALAEFPKDVDQLKTKKGNAFLMKVDIFTQLMYYSIPSDIGRNLVVGLTKEQVADYKQQIESGKIPDTLKGYEAISSSADISDQDDKDFEDVTGQIELPEEKKRRGKRRRPKSRGRRDSRKPDSRRSGSKKSDSKRKDSSKSDSNRPDAKKQDSKRTDSKRTDSKRTDSRKPKDSNREKQDGKKPSSKSRRPPRGDKRSDQKKGQNRPPKDFKNKGDKPDKPKS